MIVAFVGRYTLAVVARQVDRMVMGPEANFGKGRVRNA